MQTNTWKLICLICTVALLINSCSGVEKSADEKTEDELKPIPREVAEAIEKQFPGAMPYDIAFDSLLHHLLLLGITPDQILWGQSTCVDDITNTKDKFAQSKIKGPFTFGGLGGLPFTGITGVDAFSHHVPDAGTALLIVGPHIGCNAKEGWGKIQRHGQQHSSSCCGALSAALTKLQKNELKTKSPSEEDYQEEIIEQLVLSHQNEILTANEPLVAMTKVVSKEAEQKMTAYAHHVRETHFAFVVVVVGVIINTDYQYSDYFWIDHISVKDLKKNIWIIDQTNSR